MVDETISKKCETLYNKLNSFVTSVISRDVTPKISNLNTEVWGSNTQTGNSRIDTLNTNFNNLDSSITSMESDINNVESDVSNLQTSVNSLNTSITNLVQIQYIEAKTSSTLNANGGTGTATVTVTPLPTGYRYILFMRKGSNGIIYNDKLNGSTLTLTAQNLQTSAQQVYIRCYLIYVPTSWSYVERLG